MRRLRLCCREADTECRDPQRRRDHICPVERQCENSLTFLLKITPEPYQDKNKLELKDTE